MSKAGILRSSVLLVGSIPLLLWIDYLVSNRDPFILGGCLIATLAIGPISILLTAFALKKSVDSKWKLSLWALLLLDAGMLITILVMLLDGLNGRV